MSPLRPPGFGDPNPNKPRGEVTFTLEKAFEKADQVLAKDAITEKSFEDLYGTTNVNRDIQDSLRIKQKVESDDTPEDKEAAKLARVLEAVIHDQVNRNQWLGPHAKSLRSTLYDDLINGVDGIIEFKEPKTAVNYLALGIDVTYRKNMEKKFLRIKTEIDSGKLGTVKYLRSSDGRTRGERKEIVPRLVVGVDRQTCAALAHAWFKDAQGLKTNPVRYQIVKELYTQLVVFESYARKNGKLEVAERYAESRAIIEPLFESIKKQFANFKFEIKDKASEEIERELEMFR